MPTQRKINLSKEDLIKSFESFLESEGMDNAVISSVFLSFIESLEFDTLTELKNTNKINSSVETMPKIRDFEVSLHSVSGIATIIISAETKQEAEKIAKEKTNSIGEWFSLREV